MHQTIWSVQSNYKRETEKQKRKKVKEEVRTYSRLEYHQICIYLVLVQSHINTIDQDRFRLKHAIASFILSECRWSELRCDCFSHKPQER